MVLILDTNVVGDIIEQSMQDNYYNIFDLWLGTIIKKITKNIPNRTITFILNKSMIKDYKTGLSKRGFPKIAKPIELLFDKSLTNKQKLSNSKKIEFIFQKISMHHVSEETKIKDKYDRVFSDVTKFALDFRKFSDKYIILATKDTTTFSDLESIFTSKLYANGGRLLLVKSLENLEKTIEC